MKFLKQSEKQAVLDFISFLNTKEAWHIPTLTAHLSMCGSRISLVREMANQVNLDMYVYPNDEKPVFHMIGIGDLCTSTLIFDRVRNEIVFTTEGDMRDELESYGYVADPDYRYGVPLPRILSEGTCKLSDILPVLFEALQAYDPDKANEVALSLYKDRIDLASEDLDPEEQGFWYEEMEDAINSAKCIEIEELYVGAHPYDPACLGIWRKEEEEEEEEEEEGDSE